MSLNISDLQSSFATQTRSITADISKSTSLHTTMSLPARRQTILDIANLYGGTISNHLHSRNDLAWEYQRWMPLKGWGTALLPTDPGRWSSSDAPERDLEEALRFAETLVTLVDTPGKGIVHEYTSTSGISSGKWGASLADISPAPPIGWQVSQDWEPVFERYTRNYALKSGISSNVKEHSIRSAAIALIEENTWQYGSSNTFRSASWNSTAGSVRTVRRRLWRRTLRLVDSELSQYSGWSSDGVPEGEKNSEDRAVSKLEKQYNQQNSFKDSPLSRLATKIYVRLLAHDMKYGRFVASLHFTAPIKRAASLI